MAVNITYAVIPDTTPPNEPIKLTANCDDISAVICFTGRTICDNGCEVLYDDERLCTTVEITEDNHTTGSIFWNGCEVRYEITRDCPDTPSLSCTTKCDGLKVVPVPMYVDENYTGDIELHYNNYFTETCKDDEGNVTVKSRVKNEDISVVPIGSFIPGAPGTGEFTYTYKVDEQKYPDSCTGDVTVYKVSNPGCEDTCRVDLSIKFDRDIVPSTGATTENSGTPITVTVLFKKVVTDTECHRMTKTGSFSFPWEVPECEATSDNPYYCCEDHYEYGEIKLSDILRNGHIDNSCDVYYNGKKVTDKITYSILQKAKLTDECEHYCQPNTTYCVDQESVIVYYETSYMSNEWVSKETLSGCDCTSLIIDGVTSSLSVPFTGGRIKVTWNYSGETVTADCTKYPINGTWKEIINIGGCDERPIDCKPEYNTVVIDAEGTTAVYDNETFCMKCEDGCEECNDDCACQEGCESCDAECCYNYDGEGTCRCVILFREQTPGCETCDSETIYDVEKGKQITYNKIHYEFVQDCTPVCDYVYRIECDKQTIELLCEFEGGKSYTVDYYAVTEYVGIGCPDPVRMPRSTTIVLENVTKNDTPGEKVLVDNEFIKVVQKPCWTPPSTCSCDDLKLDGGDDPDVCGKLNMEDPTPISEGCIKLSIRKDDNKT